ncbi:MAG: hypothetical protein K0R39_1682 [Symbiobacteriaceae bacterium]|jgi:hypothetical protein|nr:hypothetical protein [Symbiobacteriaceae bacterium]
MAVIINDFELVVEKPKERPAPAGQTSKATAPVRPMDIVEVMRRQAERLERLKA